MPEVASSSQDGRKSSEISPSSLGSQKPWVMEGQLVSASTLLLMQQVDASQHFFPTPSDWLSLSQP